MDPEKPGPWKAWTRKNLDPEKTGSEKPGTWKTLKTGECRKKIGRPHSTTYSHRKSGKKRLVSKLSEKIVIEAF